jgi:uncharacterized protein
LPNLQTRDLCASDIQLGRLDVLKGVLADVTNASKTNKPLVTDVHMLNLLRKRAAASKESVAHFEQAQRADLASKESAQLAVLEEYVASVQTASSEEIEAVVEDAIGDLTTADESPSAGMVYKALFARGGRLEEGSLDGKPCDPALVHAVVKRML